jgi:hypothetical protein
MQSLRVAFVLALPLTVAACAQALAPMPRPLAERWLCSTTAGEGWNAPGYDARGWAPVTYDLPAGYPEWMTADMQARHRFMWHPGGPNRMHPVYFRRALFLDEKPSAARLQVCADDQFRLFVNGHLVGEEQHAGRTRHFEVAAALRPGANVIAVEAADVAPWGYGLLVVGEITQTWAGKTGWRCARNPGRLWVASGFDDSRWPAAVLDRAPDIVVDDASFSCVTTPTDIGDFATAYFRRVLCVDALPVTASVTVLGDDSYELYVSGKLVAVEKRPEQSYMPYTTDVTAALHYGRNALAVKVTNTWGPSRLYCAVTATMAL